MPRRVRMYWPVYVYHSVQRGNNRELFLEVLSQTDIHKFQQATHYHMPVGLAFS